MTSSSGFNNNQIIVRVVEARHLKDTDLIGRSDPYCEVRLSSGDYRNFQRTRKIHGSTNPRWDEEFTFNTQRPESDQVILTLYDHDYITSDDSLGSATFSVAQCMRVPVVDVWLDVRHPKDIERKGKGQVHVIARYKPKDLHHNQVQAPPGYMGAYPQQGFPIPPAAAPVPGYPPAPAPYGYHPAPYGAYPPAPAPYGYPPAPYGYPPSRYAYPQQPGAPATTVIKPPPGFNPAPGGVSFFY